MRKLRQANPSFSINNYYVYTIYIYIDKLHTTLKHAGCVSDKLLEHPGGVTEEPPINFRVWCRTAPRKLRVCLYVSSVDDPQCPNLCRSLPCRADLLDSVFANPFCQIFFAGKALCALPEQSDHAQAVTVVWWYISLP